MPKCLADRKLLLYCLHNIPAPHGGPASVLPKSKGIDIKKPPTPKGKRSPKNFMCKKNQPNTIYFSLKVLSSTPKGILTYCVSILFASVNAKNNS